MDAHDQHVALCINNEGYPVSLELRKVYEILPDEEAGRLGQIRIVDESGEDYLYPQDFFEVISLPRKVGETTFRTSKAG
ncbi:MAG: hypothetical protein ISS78_06765 [Phycisphaerae bacterium]|nr:hypothetical protein [Phycisphaerae bacterium]